MKKIKIGLFIDCFFPTIDGVVMVVDNYAKNLSKYCEIVVVCPTYGLKDKKIKFDYKVIRVKSLKIPLTNYTYGIPKIDSKIVKKLVNENFDLIHIHSPFSVGKLGIDVAKISNIPVIGTMHTQLKFELYKYTKSHKITDYITNLAIKVYEECDQCYAVNKRIGEVFKEYGYKFEPLVLQNGTDLKLLDNEKEAIEEVNKLYNIEPNMEVLLFVGRITLIKNIMFIIDVINVLKQKKLNFKMLFVGSGPDLKKLQKKIDNLDLSDCVVLCGKISDRELLSKIFCRAKLFIFPSLFDASSLVQIEAASQKTPTLFLEGAATSYTITPEVNGYLGKNNVNQYAKKIIEIINDNKHYNEVSENSYKDLYKTWKNITEEVYQIYLDLIKKNQK